VIVPEEPGCDPVAAWRRHVDSWWTAWEEPTEPDGEPRRLYSGPCRDDAVAVAAWHRERTGRDVLVSRRRPPVGDGPVGR
jgi:hypothetical protein